MVINFKSIIERKNTDVNEYQELIKPVFNKVQLKVAM